MRFAGIHLSGANTHKSSVVILQRDHGADALAVVALFDKIGSMGRLFSDERLVEVLVHAGPFAEVFVDCPLSVPPCVACQRPSCPGAIKCDDLSVAYMLALAAKFKKKPHRRSKPINPQNQRLWDVMRQVEGASAHEPTYTANLAPLVTRARTLQRRLNALDPQIALKETSVLFSLQALAGELGLEPAIIAQYRSFESGLRVRQQIFERFAAKGWLRVADPDEAESCVRSVENFHALTSALMAALHSAGQSFDKPDSFLPDEGWVYLPRGFEMD